MREIAASSAEQTSGTAQVNKAIQQLDQVIQQNASASEEMASTAEELSSQAVILKTSMELFQVGDGRTGKRQAPSMSPKTGAKPVGRGLSNMSRAVAKAGFQLDLPGKGKRETADDREFTAFEE